MELIQALEKLSLEIRNKKVRYHNTLNHRPVYDSQQLDSHGLTSTFTDGETSNAHDLNLETRCPSAASQRQLDEFDNSVKTLFAQISDLDYEQATSDPHCRTNLSDHLLTRKASLETSSEEYSDESSQRSSNNEITISTHCEDPIVSYLLTLDLACITDTVKKISRLLAIGSEIETLYQILAGIESVYSPRRRSLNASTHVDSLYTRLLCNEFAELCVSEPRIANLPTISRYNDIILKLMSQLDRSDGGIVTVGQSNEIMCNSTASNLNIKQTLDNDCAMEDESDNEQDRSDLDMLNAVQKNLDNGWTENKLYIDHSSR